MKESLRALIVPCDSGFRNQRMGAGPGRLVDSGILTSLPVPATIAEYPPDGVFRGEVGSAFDIQRWLSTQVADARRQGAFPLVLAGNCISAVGACAGIMAEGRSPGVCWFDAHADFNTPESSETGFLDGMALAALTGRCWTSMTAKVPCFTPVRDAGVVMFGTRDIDAPERDALGESDVSWPRSPEERASRGRLDGLGRVGEVYLHVDLDVLDQAEARVNQFACSGGLTRDQLVDLVSTIASRFRIGAMSITAYDPAFDAGARVPPIARAVLEAALT